MSHTLLKYLCLWDGGWGKNCKAFIQVDHKITISHKISCICWVIEFQVAWKSVLDEKTRVQPWGCSSIINLKWRSSSVLSHVPVKPFLLSNLFGIALESFAWDNPSLYQHRIMTNFDKALMFLNPTPMTKLSI